MAKRKSGLGGLLGAAAVAAGAAAVISKLDKEAKANDKDIIDVAKEKVEGLISDIKSGEIVDKADQAIDKVTDFANKTVEDVKSGEFTKNVQEQFNKTVDSVKSGEAFDKAQEYVKNVKASVEDLLNEKIELKVIDGLILLVLLMDESGACTFLDENGRCSIHVLRPGICRLYPLGRSWENGDFRYILQVNECTHCNGSKIKVKKWLGIPDLPAYEEYCRSWHNFLEQVRAFLDHSDPEGTYRRQICVWLLEDFFLCDWNVDDFYTVFNEKLKAARQRLGFAG